MNVKKLSLMLLLFNTSAALLAGQATPDFSGTWRLRLEKNKPTKGAKVQSAIITIRCSGASIQMRYNTDGKESVHDYTTDGKERTIDENQRAMVVAKVKWEGSVLILETMLRTKNVGNPLLNGSEIIHYKQRWKLSADGRVLTVEQDDARGVSTYDKMPN